jgi:hypothetical protein
LFCPLAQLKITLGLHKRLLFGLKKTRTKCLNLRPEWVLLFRSNPPCRKKFTTKQEKIGLYTSNNNGGSYTTVITFLIDDLEDDQK